MAKRLLIIILILAGAGAVYYFSFGRDSGGGELETSFGILEGKVTIGPLCPVERIPPDPSCQPTDKTYKAWLIAVYSLDKKTKIAQIKPDISGNYKLELPVGNYIVDLEKQYIFNRSLPTNIAIKKGEIAQLNIDIDTGIR
jgi:hypothetical protein